MKFDKKKISLLYTFSCFNYVTFNLRREYIEYGREKSRRAAFIQLTTEFQRCHLNVSIISYLVLKV